MTFERGPLLQQKCKILQNVGKNTLMTLKVHDMKRERFNMSRLVFMARCTKTETINMFKIN